MRLASRQAWVCIALVFSLGGWYAHAAADEAQRLIDAGNQHWQSGELDQAAASYKSGIEKDPGSVDAHMKLAGLYIARQEYRAGVETFQQAIGISPDNANAFIGMAIGYLHMGDPELAHAALDEAVRIDPESRERVEPLMAHIEAKLRDRAHGFAVPPTE